MKYERAPEYEQQFTRLNTPYASEWPDRRPLKIFALDPLRGKTAGNEVTITIPNERLMRGPASERIKVIDYDGTLTVYYAPVDVDDSGLDAWHHWTLLGAHLEACIGRPIEHVAFQP